MGLGPRLGSSCSCEKKTCGCVLNKEETLPNPDPRKYIILCVTPYEKTVLVKIKYLDCTNYEGVKVLVYWTVDWWLCYGVSKIDPHFCDNHPSPLARFSPDKVGYSLAQAFCKMIDKGV